MGSLTNQSTSAAPSNNFQAPQVTLPSGDPNDDPTNPFAQGKTKPDDLGDMLGIAGRATAKGIVGIIDTIQGNDSDQNTNINALKAAYTNPNTPKDQLPSIKAAIDQYEGTQTTPTFVPAINKVADAIHLATPVTKNENLLDSTVSNAAAYAVPIGGEFNLGKAAINAGAGALSGLAQGAAQQAGLGTGTQTGLGLVVGAGGILLGHGFAGKFGEPVASVVKSIPVTDVFDKDGNLTEQGQDVAAQAHTDPQTLRQAYEEASANTQVHYDNVKNARDEALQAGVPQDHPVIQAANDILDKVDSIRNNVDQVLNPQETYETPSVVDNRTSEQRLNDAAQLGNDTIGEPVQLTTGQADNNAAQLGKENTLRTQVGPNQQAALDVKQTQLDQVNQIADQLQQGLTDPTLSKADKGSMIQNAIQQLKQQSYAGVKAIWAKLSNLDNAPLIDTKPVFDSAYDAMDRYGEGDPRKQDLMKIMAKYDAIPSEFVEQRTYDPIYKQTNVALKNGKTISFNGEPQSLSIANAERMNAELNGLYDKNYNNNPHLQVKAALNDARDDALEKAASQGNVVGNIGQEAKSAYQTHMNTFAGKSNIIAKLVDKDDVGNYKLNPDKVMDTVLGPKDNISDLKKLKAVLLSNAATKDAWNVIKEASIQRLISNAMKGPNLSAAILERQIKTMGYDKLKTVLDPHEYNNIMKLSRLAKDINATGSGTSAPLHNHLINMLYHAARYSSLFLGHGASHVAAFATMGLSDLGMKAKLAREASETLSAMQEYKGKHTADKLSSPALTPERLKQFADFMSSKEFIQPLLQGALSKKDNK